MSYVHHCISNMDKTQFDLSVSEKKKGRIIGWLSVKYPICIFFFYFSFSFSFPHSICKSTMGKSAKFYKRPSKKEKEGIAVKKLVEPSAISKKSSSTTKAISVPASMFQDKAPKKITKTKVVEEEDMDMMVDNEQKVSATEDKKLTYSNGEVPDYVDLFSGKKTYKKIPKKRK
jgi:hypothetical protein